MHLQKRGHIPFGAGRLIVPGTGAVGGADFPEPGAALLQNVVDAKAVPDLHELPARYGDLPPARQRGQREQHRRRVVVDDERVPAPAEVLQQRLHMRAAAAPLPRFEVIFQVAAARRVAHRAAGRVREGRAPQIGVQRHARSR